MNMGKTRNNLSLQVKVSKEILPRLGRAFGVHLLSYIVQIRSLHLKEHIIALELLHRSLGVRIVESGVDLNGTIILKFRVLPLFSEHYISRRNIIGKEV